jgi:hypothetical protein
MHQPMFLSDGKDKNKTPPREKIYNANILSSGLEITKLFS